MDDNKSAKGFLLGMLAGGVIGSVIALLYAPKSGRELRADIKLKKDEFLDDTSEFMDIAKERANNLINEGKKKSEKLISDAKEKANTLITDANKILTDAKEKASDSISSAKEKVSVEASRIKDAFNAGVEAYKEEKNKS
ncbi:MAG TPA: gas vesicle protein [Bacteroidetes bacterium]|nr:gas vesicle protein [Bacteroidota bacterium]HCN36267.1 gas vesicle protein [Bacteroidota bacterium]